MKTIYTAEQLKSVYGEPQVQQPAPEPQKEGILKSIAKDVAGTLVVNPVTRATEAVTRTAFPESQAAKGFEMLQEEGQGQDVLGVNVPSLTGGARQITGEALKTASYLFPYGKVAGVAGKTLGKVGGNVASGTTGGYLADVGYGLTDQEQTLGEALTPGAGTAIGGAIPLAGPALRGSGRVVSKLGSKTVEAVIPVSKREAGILQTYKANNPFFKRVADVLQGTEKAPTTAGKTATTTTAGQTLPGLFGTKSQIGVQAKRAKDSLWKDVIQPRLRASEQAVDLDGFFAKVEDDIIKSNPELSRQKSLLEALNAVRDDYAGTKVVSLEGLQKLKEGWAKFVPDKAYQGKPIGGAFNDVRNQLADEARQTIYTQLGDDVKQAYFDYGNLQGLAEMGKVSMTGQKLKGGTGGLLSEILSQTITPIGTVGGQAVYRLGKGIEFVGNLGAKNLGEALGVNLKFPGDMAVDDISKTVKKAKSLPNKQGGFIKIGQDAKAPIATQSSQTASKVKNNVIPKSSPKSPTKSIDDTLITEARKYKSAEEFVKAQGTPVYRGEGGSNVAQGKALLAEGKHFASDSKYPQGFGKVSENIIKPNAKVLDLGDSTFAEISQKLGIPERKYISPKELSTIAKEKGYDVLRYNGEYKSTGKQFTHFVDLTGDSTITKSQLEDIWKKANSLKGKDEIIPTNLISEAKKYKSAEEFVKARTKLTYKNLQENDYSIQQLGKDFDEPVEYFRAGTIKKNGDIWLTDNEAGAIQYSKAGGGTKVGSYIIESKKPLIIDTAGGKYANGNIDINKILTKEEITQGYTNNPTIKQKFIDYAKKNGYDAVQFADSFPDGEGGMRSLVVWDKGIIKTKSQLEDIWKKANKSKK